ncbi:MAG: DUF1326 domain-containing protein [Pirellulales bacterium]
MFRILSICALVALVAAPAVFAGDLKGDYLETRTCDVYTGPCFANGEVGLGGNDAMMAWNIERGSYEGVELAGLKVIVVTTASDTLGFGGTLAINPQNIRSTIIVDKKATGEQHDALVSFATRYARHSGEIVKVVASPIEMTADHFELVGTLKAGDLAEITTRKLHKGDCVCSNEMTFYPPLCDVKNAAPAYTVVGHFAGPGLGTAWSNPGTRSAFLASFSY